MMFINFAKYKDLEKIASARKTHFAYADHLRSQGQLVVGGPLLDNQGRRIGLLFVYQAVSRAIALNFVQEDPFTLAKGLSSYEVTEWSLLGANLNMLIKANRSADQANNTTSIRLFASYVKYGVNKSRLAAFRPAHWEYYRTLLQVGRLAVAGTFPNNEGELSIYKAVSDVEAMSYLEHDPFTVEGVFANHQLLEWLIEGLNPDLLADNLSSEWSENAVSEQ